MEEKRDLRPIDEIPFAEKAEWMRKTLREANAKTVQDVIDLGCTGLTHYLLNDATGFGFYADTSDSHAQQAALSVVIDVRSNMAGAGFGLPCYVPPTRFCLVHNIIGGLCKGQEQRNPEGLKYCSRELTDAEELQARAMQALINQEGMAEAKAHFGAESENEPESSTAISELGPGFTCPEHKEIIFACRYCLAAAVINGPFQPVVELVVQKGRIRGPGTVSRVDIAQLADTLADDTIEDAEAFVRVKRWTRKLVVSED